MSSNQPPETGDRHDSRREYTGAELSARHLAASPLQQFHLWLSVAEAAGVVDATAMTLATVDARGQPAARIVLLKEYDSNGFTFYTDTGSDKGDQLRANPRAGLLFYWRELERQVRISGSVVQVPEQQAQAYFASRPRDSQLSAAASAQSQAVDSRAVLVSKVQELQQQYPQAIPKPARWGGYTLQPEVYEFWQGRVGRLHDRFCYRLQADMEENPSAGPGWQVQRLQP